MKSLVLVLAAGFAVTLLTSCQGHGPSTTRLPADGYGGPRGFSNIGPWQHGRYKEGRRSHSERKFMRPR